MKRLQRFLLLAAALAFGGVLGAILLPDFDPIKILIFLALCGGFGQVFYHIDQAFSKR